MNAKSERGETIAPSDAALDPDARKRDWFLQDSTWDNALWIFAPTGKLDEEHRIQIRWNFTLPSGCRFTDANSVSLLQSAKKHIALIRMSSLSTRRAQRASTVKVYFTCLRALIRWMDEEKCGRFDELDAPAIMRFTRMIRESKGSPLPRRASARVLPYLRLLMSLHRHRDAVGDGLCFDPCSGDTPHKVAGIRSGETSKRTYTPDDVAMPLIHGAIELLNTSAFDVLRARETYVTAVALSRRSGLLKTKRDRVLLRILQSIVIATPKGPYTIDSLGAFAELIDQLYAACFVVIAYLVGTRVSEILQLKVNCVRTLTTNGLRSMSDLFVITGAIYKLEADYHGREHQWVAPPPAVHAVAVLEALSAPHRQRTGRKELWLRPRDRRLGAIEWRDDSVDALRIPSTSRINNMLERFVRSLDLPTHRGTQWRVSTHQGRKTFAHFVALRDRTSLYALSQHLGHRDRAITDCGYVGTDYALDREIDSNVIEQSVNAWEQMLSAASLGGRAGNEILAKRPTFRGARIKQDLKQYARMLVDAGLVLGVCDWGYCVYRQEYSACLGNANGPNPVRREPSTCARCKNFVVSKEHRSYWLDQMTRHESLLNEPALSTQTLKIARERFSEAQAMVRSIDSTKEERSNGSSVSR